MRNPINDYLRLETELRKRCLYPYSWGRKQSNDWDFKTNFIYSTYSFESLLHRCSEFTQELKDYAFNRWYNYWSAMGVESIFIDHAIVTPESNEKHKTIDFYIKGIPFDHKNSVFPKGFGKSYQYAISQKEELIKWLYENQSSDGRYHCENRLFVVMVDKNGEHWKLKSDILHTQRIINDYLDNFNINDLVKLDLNGKEVLSDIIWISN